MSEIGGNKSACTVSEDGTSACEESLKHERLGLPSAPFFAMASEPSSLPLQAIVIEQPPLTGEPIRSSSQDHAASAVFVETNSDKPGGNPKEDVGLKNNVAMLGESLPESLVMLLPTDISSTHYLSKPPSCVVLLSGYHIDDLCRTL